ncbi:MAG TPA: tetraacyldisaccharide 4'-kinase [Gemmatimonadaceae bacterium]|jgi:tetraacyldisaccharide 4'-kinase|nr:tetraacyldisaccharide 4'-kinase [Gemmatimonadaceae bacterium]
MDQKARDLVARSTATGARVTASDQRTPSLASETVWWSDTVWARVVRGSLAPLSLVFRAITSMRNRLYDAKILRTISSPVPVVSVGNLSVGGTGKTPVAAYIVQQLRAAGRCPAIVMRGYGKDETEVHALLNPGIRIYANPDRVAGIARAAQEGADVIVLDDAFQHRRAGRDADIVLVSAERWREHEWTLPAGSLREPAQALRRATLICVTHRVANPAAVQRVTNALSKIAPDVPIASLHLGIGILHTITGTDSTMTLGQLAGAHVLAIAGIGDTRSFFGQLTEAGAIVDRRPFADHHAYTPTDVTSILATAASHKYIIATLKDAVKLRVMWPAKGPILWYVSQALEVSGGASFINSALTNLLPTSRSD